MRSTKGEERDKDDQGEYRVAVDLYTLLHSLTLLFLTLLHHDTAGLVTLHVTFNPQLGTPTNRSHGTIYMHVPYGSREGRRARSSAYSLELGAWSLEFGAWSLEFGAWSLQLGVWRLEFGAWSSTFGVCSLEFGAWSLELGVRTFDWCDVLVYVFHACAKTRVLYSRRHVA